MKKLKKIDIPDFMNIENFLLDESYFDKIYDKGSKEIIGDFKNSGLGNNKDFEGLEDFGKNRVKLLLKGLI